jgi:hypothetical protein
LVEKTNLAVYDVRDDETDGCHICFTAQEYACGPHAHKLDGALLSITKVFHSDLDNRSMRALYHHNRGYEYAETMEEMEQHLQPRLLLKWNNIGKKGYRVAKRLLKQTVKLNHC